MQNVAIVDYKRVASLFRKTIFVEIPADLVARKGNSRVGRAKCRQAQAKLTEAIRAELRKVRRLAFRGDVAIHLELFGVSLGRRDEARRTVKAILDSLKGAVYPDDRAVALLDVSMQPGPLGATIAICSAGQYADAFDVLAGASGDRGDIWDDDAPHDDPWRWNRQDEFRLEMAEEHLADWEAEGDSEWRELRLRMIDFNRELIREWKRDEFLSHPYSSSDRPGAPNIAGRVCLEHPHIPQPARVVLPGAKRDSGGSWTASARDAFGEHIGHWWPLTAPLSDIPVALDIAVGRRASGGFDIDNLAFRVLRAFLEAVPECSPIPPAYRAYRWHGGEDAVVIRFQSVERARQLRLLLSGSSLAASGLRPHPEGPVYRRRPSDEAVFERMGSG